MSNATPQGGEPPWIDPRDIEPAYASDDWASRRGYEIAMAWDDKHRIGQADDIADEFRKLRDHLQAQIAALSAPAPEQGVDANGLLPCPHCQARAYLYDYDTEIDMWPVRCNNAKCNAQVCSPISEADAIARWNQRTPPAPAVPAIPDEIANTIRCALDETAEDIGMNPQFYADPQEAIRKVEAALAWLESRQHRAASDE